MLVARNKRTVSLSEVVIENDGRLESHALRKSCARRVYESSGHDILLLSAVLNHASIETTQRYLAVDDDALKSAMQKCGSTRGRDRVVTRVWF